MTVPTMTLIVAALIVLELAVVAAYERLLTVTRRENALLLEELDEARDLMADILAGPLDGRVAHPSLAVIDGGRS